MTASRRTVVKLHADDNVVIACLTIAKGDVVEVDGLKIEALAQIPVGHKMAIRMLSVGEKIVKWGVPVGSAISPVIKICANPETYARLQGGMDINAGSIIEGHQTIDAVGEEIVNMVEQVAAGETSASERLGHQEFILTYKSFDEPIGPSCFPR